MPKISPADLEQLLTTLPPGSTMELRKSPTGEISVVEQPLTKQQLIEQKYAHLVGQGISLNEAAEKYDVPRAALRSWVYRAQDVRFVDEESWPKLVDEAEVALCAEIYHERKASGLTGVPFFDDDGRVIEDLKHPKLAAYRRRKKKAAQGG